MRKRWTFPFVAIAIFVTAGMVWSTADTPDPVTEPMMMTPEELQWGPVASMGEGAEIAFMEGDISQEEPFTFRLRLEDGYRILPHVHPEYERVTVLSGTLHFAHGEEFDPAATRALPVGSLAIMPPGDPMFGYAEGEVVIQLHGNGPWGIEYLNPEDDPRR